MKKLLLLTLIVFALASCGESSSADADADADMQKKTEQSMQEANRQVGMPAMVNYQEKKNLKWIYELCDKEDFICHAYLFNTMTGQVGQYLGECIGYGIPYSTQFSNPERVAKYSETPATGSNITLPQPEPNGLFKPEGLSATWLIMIDPETKEPRPVYVEPEIIVSPFKLK